MPKRELYEVVCDMRELGLPVGLIRNYLDMLNYENILKQKGRTELAVAMFSLFEGQGFNRVIGTLELVMDRIEALADEFEEHYEEE